MPFCKLGLVFLQDNFHLVLGTPSTLYFLSNKIIFRLRFQKVVLLLSNYSIHSNWHNQIRTSGLFFVKFSTVLRSLVKENSPQKINNRSYILTW